MNALEKSMIINSVCPLQFEFLIFGSKTIFGNPTENIVLFEMRRHY